MTRLNIPLFVALAAAILSAAPASGSRETLPHQRMIRRRGPGPIEGRVVAFDHGIYVRQDTASVPTGGPSTTAGPATTSSPSPAPSTTSVPSTTSAPSTTSTQSSSTVATTSSGGLLDSLTNLLSATTSTGLSTSTAPSTTSVAPSTSAAPTAVAPSTTSTPAAAVPSPTLNLATAAPSSTNAATQSNVIVTRTVAPAEEASQSAAAAKKAKITQNTIISLVVIAACIGGAIAIWTVIRKWKLSPSEKFDDRMQPIDWAPQGAGGNEETMEEKRHRRAGSSGSHGSFTSAGAGKSESGHANGVYNDSQHGHAYGAQAQDFPPAHDFTAGAVQPGYGQYYGGQQQHVGGAGYADLQRGPSVSESTYSHGASVTRGLSYSRGPVAGYDAQPGAAGVPPLPNPYGGEYGYDDYAPQAGQAQAQPQTHQAQVPYRGYN